MLLEGKGGVGCGEGKAEEICLKRVWVPKVFFFSLSSSSEKRRGGKGGLSLSEGKKKAAKNGFSSLCDNARRRSGVNL